MLDTELDDRSKEESLREAGIAVFLCSAKFVGVCMVALFAALAIVYFAELSGITSRHELLALTLRVDYIVGVSAVAFFVVGATRRWTKSRTNSVDPQQNADTISYSSVDKLFHMLAFASPTVLKAAANVEDRLCASSLKRIERNPPIFISSLPRGGTTALLNALSEVPGLASHRYRDMPFITAPSVWAKISGGDRRVVVKRQRAHGDGMEIDLNSAEAFDEIVWKLFWPQKYDAGVIAKWTLDDRNDEGEKFFIRHMQRVVGSRSLSANSSSRASWRYLSKNNANIARLEFLPYVFEDCDIVIPIRRPDAHAFSLFTQHVNFSKVQAEDDFVRRYMRDIGHYDFGRLHQPIQFRDFDPQRYDRDTPDYWLAYWIAAFREIASYADSVLIVPQDQLRAKPAEVMGELLTKLNLDVRAPDFRKFFRDSPDESRREEFSKGLMSEADAIYSQIDSFSITPS